MERFDVMVIGGGQGGLPAAHLAANLGANVALVEAREVGGT
jgi:glutathione reductase (NADPH)